MYDEIYVFFDTNALEVRVGKRLFLSQIKFSNLYYEIENFIKDLNLQKNVHLCIPEVVWMEILSHMKREFKAEKQSMVTVMSEHKKFFGDLFDYNIEFRDINRNDLYDEYVDKIAKEFIQDEKLIASIVPFSRDERTLIMLLEKAIQGISPFLRVTCNKKEYSDAGFKDALIFETMIQKTGDNLGILISDDNDFAGAFKYKENLRQVKTSKELENIIIENFEIINEKYLEARIKNNDYLIKQIINQVGYEENIEYFYKGISNIKEMDEGYSFNLSMKINRELINIYVIYNFIANELMEVELTD